MEDDIWESEIEIHEIFGFRIRTWAFCVFADVSACIYQLCREIKST